MRSRVMVLAVQVAAIAVVLFALPTAILAANYFVTDEHAELERVANTLAVATNGDLERAAALPAAASPPDVQISVYRQDGSLASGSGPAGPPAIVQMALTGRGAFDTVDGRYAVAAPIADGDVVVGVVLATVDHSETYRKIAMAWALMALLAILALVLAWLLARRLSRTLAQPVEALRSAADRLGEGDFSTRAPESSIAELDSLATSVNKTAQRLGTLVDRERAFAADLSHQLRTPLAGLRLTLESGLAAPADGRQQTLTDALTVVDRLDTTITDLLTLARDTAGGGDPADLRQLLAELERRWHGPLAERGRPLRVIGLPDAMRPRMSHACARQVGDVLMDNASTHGRGAITVQLRDAVGCLALDVSDEGPELDRDLSDLFARRSPTATGTGIGLALAQSLATAEGARLTLSRRDPPTFTLYMPSGSDDAW